MKRTQRKLLALAASAVLAAGTLFGTGICASANSAQKSWNGSYASGAIVTDENCPVVVENEVLTFDIPEFPTHYYDENINEFLGYGAKVTAKYSFYNPADYTVDMNLVFPFGMLPSYSYFYEEQPDDTAKYVITADGEQVERNLRHSFYLAVSEYDNDAEMGKLCDGFKEDAFFSPTLTVKEYRFRFTDIVYGSGYSDAYFEMKIGIPDGARVMGNLSGHAEKNGSFSVMGWAKNGYDFTVYVLGAEEVSFDCTFFTNGYANKRTAGTATLISEEELTFKEFALWYRDENSQVSETDWYNAVLDSIDFFGDSYYCGLYALNVSERLMRWYEYSLTLEPHSRLVNEVTAPIYPSIDGYFIPAVYGYEYLLSPAQCWAEFGEFELIINTPFYLLDGMSGLEKTDYGYHYNSETLPQGELRFSLCSSPSPERDRSGYTLLVFILLIVFVVPIGLFNIFGAVLCGIVLAVVYATKKK